MANNNDINNLGKILKQRRLMISLTLREISTISGISSSHLGRIERGERFPSASVLRKIAKPLDFEESELFALAGYLSPQSSTSPVNLEYNTRQLDPLVAMMLAQEPVEVQRTVITIFTILKSVAKGVALST